MSGRRGGLARLALGRPIGVLAVLVAVLLSGLVAYRQLPVNLMPDITYPMIRVQVRYGQVPPGLLVQQVSWILEQELAQTEGVELVESTTQRGQVQLTLSFAAGTNLDAAIRDASAWLDRAKSRLPRDVDPPVIFKFDPSNLPVVEFTVSAPEGGDLVALRRFTELGLANRLLGVPGVTAIRTAGGREREIQVNLDADRMAAHRVGTKDLVDALAARNVTSAAGRVDAAGRELAAQTMSALGGVDAIGEVPIAGANGASLVRVRDVAGVVDTHREQRILVRVNGRDAVKLSVFKQPQANSVAVATALRQRLADLHRDGFIPSTFDVEVTADESIYIRQAIASARNALILAVALVAGVVLLFLRSLRLAVIVCAVIPVALAATALTMRGLGLSLNLMSIGGLILGVGLLVDYGVVLLEASTRHVELGAERRDAIARAAAEVSAPLIASTTTHVAGVLPFLAMGGFVLLFFKELIVTVTVATVAGLLAALAVVPALYPLIGARASRAEGTHPAGRVSRLFRAALERVIGHPRPVLLGAVAATAVATGLLAVRGYTFLPGLDDGRITIQVQGEAGTLLADVDAAVRRVEEGIRQEKDVALVDATVGGRIGQTIQETPAEAERLVQLAPRDERNRSVQAVIDALAKRLKAVAGPGVRVKVQKARIRAIRTFAGQAGTGDWDVAVRIEGPEVGRLSDLAGQARAQLSSIQGLSDLDSSLVLENPELRFDVDGERARVRNIDAEQTATAAATAISGTVPTRLLDGGYLVDVRVWFDRPRVHDLTALPALPLVRHGDDVVRLGEVAALREATGPLKIDRVGQQNVNVLTANVRGRPLSDVAREVRSRMAALTLPPGYSLSYGGRMEFASAGTGVGALGLLALFFILVVLAVQYESLRAPLLIVAVIPFGLVGAVPTLYVAGLPLSSTVLVGLLLLAGIAVNNSVVLVDFAEQRRRSGAPPRDAVLEAALVRLRPICMTALAAMLGMLPLATGAESGGEMLQPLAVTVMGGLSAATVASLLVLPAAYVAFVKRRQEETEGTS